MAPSAGLLEARVAEIRKVQRTPRAIGFHLTTPWNGPKAVKVDGEELPVWFCPSVLAIRERLAQSEGSAVPPVILTDRPEGELGQDVLARLTKRRLYRLDAWDALRDRFGVREIDRRLREERWLPEHLLAIPPSEIVKPASGFLDLDEVWQLLLSRLGFTMPSPDLRDLLAWTTRPEGLAMFMLLPPDAREAYAKRLAMSPSPPWPPSPIPSRQPGEGGTDASTAIVRLILAGRGREAVAAGLVCEVLFAKSGTEDAQRAAGRFEASLLGHFTLTPEAGRAWAEGASDFVRQRLNRDRDEKAVVPWLAQAAELLAELNVPGLARRSSWLQAGLEQAAGVFAERLPAFLDKPDAARLAELTAAGRAVIRHGLAPVRTTEAAAVENMMRLARWLAGRKGTAPAGSFAEAAAIYASDGSWVDRVRTGLADAALSGSPGETLGAARDRLLQSILEKREEESRRFAELLAGWSEIGTAVAPMVPIEAVLDRVVAPLADEVSILLLVLDGLSFAVYRELAEDLGKRGWEEHRPLEAQAGLFGIGLLPTVTQVCRASLLSGDRRTGDARIEAKGFEEHPGLRRRSSISLPPVLFHKNDLVGDGSGLSKRVRDEVAKASRKVVGVVLNVVDDQLPKGGQLVARWEVSAIRYLEELLQAAADAGRMVVLTADHGHVIERRTELRRAEASGTAGARFRTPGSAPPEAGEVAVRGPRVLLGEGSGLILAWSEGHRYTAKQSGYHGGASPQEVVVPLAVWSVAGAAGVPGWNEVEASPPGWWDESREAAPIPREPAPKPEPAAEAPVPKLQPTLFDALVPPAAPQAWLADLFASPVYRDQKSRTSRQPLPDEEVGAVLSALAERGGRLPLAALARQRGTSVMRAQGLVAALQRLLNVEGYPVLSLDPVTGTVTLERELLRTQFPRGES